MNGRLDIKRNIELVERIAGVTEELEDILAVSRGKKGLRGLRARLKLDNIMELSRKGIGTHTQTDENGAKSVANRIKKKMIEGPIVKSSKIRLSLSQGITTYMPREKRTVEPTSIIFRADKALLSAKKKGRNKIVFLEISEYAFKDRSFR